MTSSVVCVGRHEALTQVAQRLIDAHVTGFPVTEEGRLVGLISRSDFVRTPILLKTMDEYVSDHQREDSLQQAGGEEFSGYRSRLRHLTVADAMTTEVVTCLPDTPIAEVGARMVNHHVHRIIVVDDDRPVGIIGGLDLVRLLMR